MKRVDWEIMKMVGFLIFMIIAASIYSVYKETKLCEEFGKKNKVETVYTAMQGCLIHCDENFKLLRKGKYNESKVRVCK